MLESKSFIATPPGATIKEQLENREMSQKEFAERMNLSEKHVSNLINGNVLLTPEVACRLESVLGVPAAFWNKLEAIYREKIEKIKDENLMQEDIAISSKFPYKEMASNDWIKDTNKKEDRVSNLRKFFGLSSLSLIKNQALIPGIACRRQAETEKADYALIAWAQKAKIEARNMTVSSIDIKKLEDELQNIRKMTMEQPQKFCLDLINVLAECGIAIVFLPHIGGSFLHGATFCDKKKIVVGMTVRGKDADKFWFSLFHELGHIILGHIYQPNGTSEEDENQANDFARQKLIPDDVFKVFVAGKCYTKSSVKNFALKVGIDPGIVVGRLQKEGIIKFSWLNDLKTKYKLSQ